VRCSVLQCVTVCCSALQCVAARYGELQRVAVHWKHHSNVRHDSITCATWLIHMCDMTHSHVWHDWYPAQIELLVLNRSTESWDESHTYEWVITLIWISRVAHVNALQCIGSTIHTCDRTQSHDRHDSFTCATWLIQMCDMAHSHVWHDWYPAQIELLVLNRSTIYMFNLCLSSLQHTVTHCNTMQHTATHYIQRQLRHLHVQLDLFIWESCQDSHGIYD